MIQALHAAHRGIIHRHHAHRVDERDEYRNMLFQPSIYLGDRAYRCHHHDDEGCNNDPLGQPSFQMVDGAESGLRVIQIVVSSFIHLRIVYVFLNGTKVSILFQKKAKRLIEGGYFGAKWAIWSLWGQFG